MNQARLYRRFAEVYDLMGADHHSRRMVSYTQEIMDRFGIEVTDMLDLCCGTGTALSLFAKRGWNLHGLDGSADMLKVARKKLAGTGAHLHQAELPSFRIPAGRGRREVRAFDLVTCFYDSLNYMLTEAKLKAAFRSVYRHLRPGGWFIFDMNTPEALKTLWDESVYAGTNESMGWVWKNLYHADTKTADCEATFFVKSGKHYERFTEIHRERGYSNPVIRGLLKEAGFDVRGYYRCLLFTRPNRESYRICGVAQRPERKKKGRR